ncbi:MAG: hypothetical protein ABIP79_09515 [Chitinophagaceae bacterium]
MNNKEKKVPALAFCVLLDLVGYASFTVPVLGEFADIIWAPMSALIFFRLFGGRMGVFGGAFGFIEELLPFTDFIPTFSIAWCMRYFGKKDEQRIIKMS